MVNRTKSIILQFVCMYDVSLNNQPASSAAGIGQQDAQYVECFQFPCQQLVPTHRLPAESFSKSEKYWLLFSSISQWLINFYLYKKDIYKNKYIQHSSHNTYLHIILSFLVCAESVVRITASNLQRIQIRYPRYRKGPLSQRSAGHMQNRKTKTNTNPSPDPNQCRRRCPDPNAGIQKFIHYVAIATFAIADLCDSGLSPLLSRWFWAILTASVNVILLDSKSFRTAFIHVIRGWPGNIFQFSGGTAVGMVLASALSSSCACTHCVYYLCLHAKFHLLDCVV